MSTERQQPVRRQRYPPIFVIPTESDDLMDKRAFKPRLLRIKVALSLNFHTSSFSISLMLVDDVQIYRVTGYSQIISLQNVLP